MWINPKTIPVIIADGSYLMFHHINPIIGKYQLNIGTVILVAIACFVGVFLGFIREKSGDILCPVLFHGIQDFAIQLIPILSTKSVMFVGLAIGWIIFLIKPFEKFLQLNPPDTNT